MADLVYDLPKERIAQSPAPRREDARMLVVDRSKNSIRDGAVGDFPGWLAPHDLLVLNDTRVIPARFLARRMTGGLIAGLFLDEPGDRVWHVLLEGSKRLRAGESLQLGTEQCVRMELLENRGEGHWLVIVPGERSAGDVLERIGFTPLPPYIQRKGDAHTDRLDRSRYQTVYARRPGAVAAPTAGLHFTEAILQEIRKRGVEVAFVTLHVGLGTFKPITARRIEDHIMHNESFEITQETVEARERCRARGGRVVAVGTTSLRVLETVFAGDPQLRGGAQTGSTRLFIYPPYQFRAVDALLTNFHLPNSTLLALVMAFSGVELTRRAYAHAIAENYRFYSFGDAMFIY